MNVMPMIILSCVHVHTDPVDFCVPTSLNRSLDLSSNSSAHDQPWKTLSFPRSLAPRLVMYEERFWI